MAQRLPAAEARVPRRQAAGLSVTHTPRQQAQRQRIAQLHALTPPAQSPSAHGLPPPLRAGIESLSGLDMSGVRVHRNSSQPAALQAHAFAQGQDIHLGPGQERHLPHEAWHVVQQAQGRVQPSVQMKGGVPLNSDPALEREADVMGVRAAGQSSSAAILLSATAGAPRATNSARTPSGALQRQVIQRQLIQRQVSRQQAQALVTFAAPAHDWGSRPIQAVGAANVHLQDDDGPVVAAISFHERVPTSAKGGGGDHVVAETLIQRSMKALSGLRVPQFLEQLAQLVTENLEGHEQAQHTDPISGDRSTISADDVLQQIHTGAESVSPFALGGWLSNLLTMYWRLLETRESTAYNRGEGLTTGGTGGIGEEQGRKLLLALETRIDAIPGERWWTLHQEVEDTARVVVSCMDIVVQRLLPVQVLYLCHRAAQHAATAVGVANTDWINKVAAHAYAQLTDHRIAPRPCPPNPFI